MLQQNKGCVGKGVYKELEEVRESLRRSDTSVTIWKTGKNESSQWEVVVGRSLAVKGWVCMKEHFELYHQSGNTRWHTNSTSAYYRKQHQITPLDFLHFFHPTYSLYINTQSIYIIWTLTTDSSIFQSTVMIPRDNWFRKKYVLGLHPRMTKSSEYLGGGIGIPL